MIRIEIKLFVTLAKHLPKSADAFAVEPGTTIDGLIRLLGIDETRVKLIFVNGVKKGRDYHLKDGDRVGVFPPVGGG